MAIQQTITRKTQSTPKPRGRENQNELDGNRTRPLLCTKPKANPTAPMIPEPSQQRKELQEVD